MCHLFIPLCPFVLHSVTYHQPLSTDWASLQQLAKELKTIKEGTEEHLALVNDTILDAKILHKHLSPESSRPSSHTSPDSTCNTTSSATTRHPSTPPRQIYPSTLRRRFTTTSSSTDLPSRTSWTTCPCSFASITVDHPYTGSRASRASFGTGKSRCWRCSRAAMLLKMERRGGVGETIYRHNENRALDACVFYREKEVVEYDFSSTCFKQHGGKIHRQDETKRDLSEAKERSDMVDDKYTESTPRSSRLYNRHTHEDSTPTHISTTTHYKVRSTSPSTRNSRASTRPESKYVQNLSQYLQGGH